jgi:hypothetical protein
VISGCDVMGWGVVCRAILEVISGVPVMENGPGVAGEQVGCSRGGSRHIGGAAVKLTTLVGLYKEKWQRQVVENRETGERCPSDCLLVAVACEGCGGKG